MKEARRAPVVVPFRPRWSRFQLVDFGPALVLVPGATVAGQNMADAHVKKDKRALVYFTRDDRPQVVGDRIGELSSDGRQMSTALAYGPVLPECVDHLGAGAALATGPDGRDYALTVVSDSQAQRAWIAWARREDSSTWEFKTRDSMTGNVLPLSSNPLWSDAVIRRADWAWQSQGPPVLDYWRHLAMRYFNGFFYAAVGYSGRAGMCATWWKIGFDPRSASGLGEVSRAMTGGGGVVEDDDLWSIENRWPGKPGAAYDLDAADPSEIVEVDGELVFLYVPVAGANGLPTPICYVPRGRAAAPQVLDLSDVWRHWSPGVPDLSPAGNAVTLRQVGDSNMLDGYVTAAPKDDPNGRQGLLPITVEMVL